MIGTVLSGYQIISKIKDGSVGTVWKGRNPFNEDVAIKVLSAAHARDAKKLKEFRNEAKVLGLLKHPQIIRIVKFVDASPQLYVIMEYFNSENLKHAMMNMPERVRGKEFKILRQLCDALHAMHQQGVIHLDIKPENVLLSETSEIRLIDFSITQPVRGRMFKFGKTQWGGTPAYMAPEQIRGEAVSPASDQYSFGVLAYELFARRTPFLAPTQNALLEKHLVEAPPPLRKTLPKVPQDVDRVILRLLEKDPAARWADMAAVSFELNKLADKWGLWWVDAGLTGTTRTSVHTARMMQPTTPPQGAAGADWTTMRGNDVALQKTHPIPTTPTAKGGETARMKPAAPAPRPAPAAPPSKPPVRDRASSKRIPAVTTASAPEPWRPVGERAAAAPAPAPKAAPVPAPVVPVVPAAPAVAATRETVPVFAPAPPPSAPAPPSPAPSVTAASVPAQAPVASASTPVTALPPSPEPPAPTTATPAVASMDGLDDLLQARLQRRIEEERQRKQKQSGGEGASSEALPRTAPHESDINLPAVR